MLLDALNNLTLHHTKNCPQYRLIIEGIFADWQHKKDVSGIPYRPVSIFKTQKLMSIKDEELFKICLDFWHFFANDVMVKQQKHA